MSEVVPATGEGLNELDATVEANVTLNPADELEANNDQGISKDLYIDQPMDDGTGLVLEKPTAMTPTKSFKNDSASGRYSPHRSAKVATPSRKEHQRDIPHNPAGLHKNVAEMVGGGDGEDLLVKVNEKLLPGEELMDSFNVFFEEGMMPFNVVLFYICISFGLAIFYFAYRMFLRMCYRFGIIHPQKISFKRGIMVVTSYGRLLMWHAEAEQKKSPNMVNYDWCNWYNPKNFLKLAIDAIRIVTFNYKLIGLHNTCAPPMKYTTSTFFGVYHLRDLRQLSVVSESQAPCCGLCCCCPNFSSSICLCFTGACDDDVNNIESISPGIRAEKSWANYINDILHGNESGTSSDGPLIAKRTHMVYIDLETNRYDKVHEKSAREIVEELSELAGQILAHNNQIIPLFKGEGVERDDIIISDAHKPIVHNDGKVTLPSALFPLFPHETVLAVHGQIFRPKFYQWVLAFLTLGLYYIFYLRPKRYLRTAFVTTTHRIAEFIINQREGCVPEHGSNYVFAQRSFFPRRVEQHGFISRSRNRISVGLMTDFGALSINFDSFGRADTFQNVLTFYELFSKNENYPIYSSIPRPVNTVEITGIERTIIHLQEGEYVIGRYQGENVWRPFPGCEMICNTKACCYPLYPFLPWLLTCSLRPKRNVASIVLTNKSVYFLSAVTNYTCTYCSLSNNFNMAYAPLADFLGVSTQIDTFGKEWCARRIWQLICCCDVVRAIFPTYSQEYSTEATVSTGVYLSINGRAIGPTRPREEMDQLDMIVAQAQKAIWDANQTSPV